MKGEELSPIPGDLLPSFQDNLPVLPVVLRLAGPVTHNPVHLLCPVNRFLQPHDPSLIDHASGTAGRIPGTGTGTPDTFTELPDCNKAEPDRPGIEMSFQFPVRWHRAFPADADPPGVHEEEVSPKVAGKNQAHTRITSRTDTFSRW